MKFMKWIESVDPHVLPLSVDVGAAVFSAALLTALLKMLVQAAA
ncbi:MAG TPA: hypothetical protein VFQ87_20795 [Bradyrhizobium sp.]|jgi:hypothetical protein|nr:hypothetical protein [Bradyrhizobium sp.]